MKREFGIILGLLVMTLTAFSGIWIWHSGFVNFDDYGYVAGNPHVLGGLSAENFGWAWTTFDQGNYLPLTWLSFMQDVTLFRSARPVVFHSVNVAIHAINAVLVFLVFRQATGAVWRSALVAAVFAVHPLRVESVVWVVERKDVLSGFFAFLTMLAYLQYTRRPRWTLYAATALLFAATLLAKQVPATLPCVLLLMDYWPLGRWEKGPPALGPIEWPRRSWTQLVLEKIPLLAMSAGILVITAHAQGAGGAISDLKSIPLSERLANIPVAYVRYLGKTFWFGDLSVFYPLHQWEWWQVAASCLILVGITILCLWNLRRFPWLTIGWLWFLGVLVPMIGLVQFGHVPQAMADRFTYFSGIGLLVMLIWSIPGAAWRQPELSNTTVASLLGLLMVFTIEQTQHWTDTVSLWKRATEVEDSATAELNYGGALFEKEHLEKKHIAEAIIHLNRSVALDRNKANAQASLAKALTLINQTGDAISHLTIATDLEPSNLKWQSELALLLLQTGQDERAERQTRNVLVLHPKWAEGHRLLGVVLCKKGASAIDEGIAELKLAISIKPDFQAAENDLKHYRNLQTQPN